MIRRVILKSIYYSSLWVRNLFTHEYIDALKSHCRGRVLDVGGGNFYEYFNKNVQNYTSYTNLEHFEELLVDGYPVRNRQYRDDSAHHTVYGDGTQIPFRNQSFDTVINAQVLEHIPDPLAMIQEIYHVLKPGGKAIFLITQTTPVHSIPFHYGNLSLYGAREILGRAGFQIIDEKYCGGLWRTILFRHLFFFLQLFRVPGFSSPEFKRHTLYYILTPFMALYALINIPILLVFNLTDHKEDAGNLVFVVTK